MVECNHDVDDVEPDGRAAIVKLVTGRELSDAEHAAARRWIGAYLRYERHRPSTTFGPLCWVCEHNVRPPAR
jgi:hypothetical protein